MGTLRARRPDDVPGISRVVLAEWQGGDSLSPNGALGGARFPPRAFFSTDTPHFFTRADMTGADGHPAGARLGCQPGRIRPAKERTAYYSAESRPGWLGGRSPATRPGAWYLGHAPCEIWGQSWVQFPGEGVFDFSPKSRKKRPKRAKTRQNGPKTAPAQPRAPLARPALLVFAGRSVEITGASRVWTRSSASRASTTGRLDCR